MAGYRVKVLFLDHPLSDTDETAGWQNNTAAAEFITYPTVLPLTLENPVVTVRTARFNIHKFCVLPTQCIYVFCVDLRKNSNYFPIQH
jgi:hypothetical protein